LGCIVLLKVFLDLADGRYAAICGIGLFSIEWKLFTFGIVQFAYVLKPTAAAALPLGRYSSPGAGMV
jgi:hypothetical protein